MISVGRIFHNDSKILTTPLLCRKTRAELLATSTVLSATKHFDAILETYKIQSCEAANLGN